MSRKHPWPLAVLAVLLGLFVVIGRGRRPPKEKEASPDPFPMRGLLTPIFTAGLSSPPAHPARDVKLPDDARVVGVVAGGKPRAYLLSAMRSFSRQVVNDLVGDVAVTVVYCDRTDRVRTFTGDAGGDVLPVDAGTSKDKLILRVKNKFYWHHTGEPLAPVMGPFPYAELPHERTTWKTWREAQPDTEVFTGE